MIISNRQIWLPVGMGDTVYTVVGDEVYAFVVYKVTIDAIGEYATCYFRATNEKTGLEFGEADIRSKVFLTRAEAEARICTGGV